MSSLVEDDLTRAATFFTLALGIAVGLGLLMGDLRLGVRWGLALGVVFGIFAYVFVRPTATGGAASSEAETVGVGDVSESDETDVSESGETDVTVHGQGCTPDQGEDTSEHDEGRTDNDL